MGNENRVNDLTSGVPRTPGVTSATYVRLIQLSIDTLGNALTISIPKTYVPVLLGATYSTQSHMVTIWLEPRGWSKTVFGYKNFRVVLLKGV